MPTVMRVKEKTLNSKLDHKLTHTHPHVLAYRGGGWRGGCHSDDLHRLFFFFFSLVAYTFLGLARQEAETHYETPPSPRVRIKACDRGVCSPLRFDH